MVYRIGVDRMNILDVANAAGVSTATVSRVLNGKSDVKPETRERVLSIIEKLNYTPRVSKAEPDTVALFAPMDMIRTNPGTYYLDFVLGVSHSVFDFDLNLEIVSLRRVPKKKSEFVRFCRERRISCGVFVQTSLQDSHLAELIEGMPFLVIGNHLGEGIPCVMSDNYGGAYRLVKFLVERGHRRIGVVASDMRFPDHVQRVQGYNNALADSNLVLDDRHFLLISGRGSTYEDVEHGLRAMLLSPNPPTALVTTNTLVAAEVVRAIESMDLRIPDDVSVAGFDDDIFAMRLNPPLTTVRQPVHELGQVAAKTAIGLYEGSLDPSDVSIVLDTELVIRGSVKMI